MDDFRRAIREEAKYEECNKRGITVPRRDIDFEINLKSDQPPPVRSVIRLSSEQLTELKKQLRMLLDKGLIKPSSSPCGAPVSSLRKRMGSSGLFATTEPYIR